MIGCMGFVVVLMFMSSAINRSWMSDDAYITLRVVDNWINGYGLRWNVNERVQAFTHPLWLLLISMFYFFTKEAYLTTLIISLLISCITIVLIWLGLGTGKMRTVVALLLLWSSSAFVDYNSSGLENPLSHLLLLLFLLFFCMKEEKDNF